MNIGYENDEKYGPSSRFSHDSRQSSAATKDRSPVVKEPLTQGRYMSQQNNNDTREYKKKDLKSRENLPKNNSYPEIQEMAQRVTRTRARFEPLVGVRSLGQSLPVEASPPSNSNSWYKNSFIVLTVSFLVVLAIFSGSLLFERHATQLGSNGSDMSLAQSEVKNRYDILPQGFDINTLPLGGLPPGSYTRAGTGNWRILPVPEGVPIAIGPSDGINYNYVVGIEQGITDPSIMADPDSVADLVDSVYASPYGWTSPKAEKRVRFTRIGPGQKVPNFQVLLTTPETTKKLCGFDIPIESSCYLDSKTPGQSMIVLNLARYLLGAKSYGGDTMSYREYEINHETGHAIGYGHQPCMGNGRLAPLMMEQTFSLTNSDIYKFDKSGIIPDNNLTCRPNPWPYPPHN